MATICFRCFRKGMSSSTKRGVAPVAPVVGLKSSPSSGKQQMSNGSGPPSLTYEEPHDDENMNEVIEENVELEVILPNGQKVTNVVDHGIPMLDLLIQLAVKNKVNPSNYTLVAISEETGRPIDYKANQTIGSLETQTLRLVPKKQEDNRKKGKNQPFEMTHRFTVNLPRNQKMVNRLSPAMPLGELFQKVCQEKNLNPSHYRFQHAQHPDMRLDLNKMTIGDLKCNEINFVNSAMIDRDSAQSMPDLSRSESGRLPHDPSTSYMPGVAEPKKKRGFLSFLKKDKKFKLTETEQRLEAQMNQTPPQSSSSRQSHKPLTPPAERRTTGISDDSHGVRPKSMFVSSKPSELENGHISVAKENTLPRAPPRTGKKRQAPPPPTQKTSMQPNTVEVVIKDQNQESQNKTEQKVSKPTEGKNGPDSVTQRLHSRNSSDSSGYHELTLSGAESPEAGRGKSTFKTSIDATSIESVDNNNDSGITDITPSHNRAIANQMSAGDSQTLPSKNAIAKPPRQRSHSLERNASQSTQIKPSAKKKRAPAPPQPSVSVKPLPTHEEVPSSVETTSQSNEPIRQLDSDITQLPEQTEITTSFKDDVVDKLDDVLKNGDMSHDDMMAERASLVSEDIDNILVADPKPTRPCEFVAPPPPLEPPPDLVQDVEKEYADKGVVVNDDNASLPPASLKGSPSSNHSRISSQSSIDSTTIEDLGLDFEKTIALGEESLANEKDFGYKNEMAMFVQNMTKLTVGSDAGSIEQSGSATPSVQDNDESETGSFVHHTEQNDHVHVGDTDTDSLAESEMSTQSDMERRERERQARLSAIFSNSNDKWEEASSSPRAAEEPKKIGHAINQKLLSPDADHPIPFDYPPPPEFQNDDQNKNDNSFQPVADNEEEEEEEWTETVEEVVYHLGPKSSYTFGGAFKNIPDMETKKEPESPQSKSSQSLSSFTYYQEPETKTETKSAPQEKEEFILTTSDLAKVNFVASPPMQNRNSKSSYLNGKPTGYVDPSYKGNNSYQHGSRSDYNYSPVTVRDEVYQKRSSENFSSVRETQRSPSPVNPINVYTSSTSLSMATPRELTPSGWVARSEPKEIVSSSNYDDYEESSSPRYQVNTTTYSRLLTPSGWQATSPPTENSRSPSVSPSISDSMEESKIAQYEQLEEQLKQWQEQLEINQNILASQQCSPENQVFQEQMLTQIEMQKQMMEQLQKSMTALTKDIPSNKRPPSPSPVPEPVPPPAPPVVQSAFQLKKVNNTQRPPVKRFEPKLDPREELMIAIRSFGGRNGLDKHMKDASRAIRRARITSG